ncbi:MAG: GGDEF domain-containing protein, partial [Actinomycetes bacterium]
MRRFSRFSVTFTLTVASAVVLLAGSATWGGWSNGSLGLLIVFAGAVLFEIRPLTVLRYPDPITIHLGQSFSLAALYVWGVEPAMVVAAGSWFVGQALAGKQLWRTVFNAAQFVIAMAAAGLTMTALGGSPVGQGGVLVWSDLGWVVATWLVHLIVNDVLVSLLAESDGGTFWGDLTYGLRWYLFSDLLADTLAIVVVVLVAAGAWYPLVLVVPMVMFAMTYSLTRNVEHESLHDELTTVANRRQLLKRLADQIGRQTSYAVVLVDLDRFKQVNDRHGHQAGDAVLQTTAERLGRVVRDTDLVARIGG